MIAEGSGDMLRLGRITFGRGTPFLEGDITARIAAALSVPRGHVVGIRDPDQSERIAGVVGVLPAPFAELVPPPPANFHRQDMLQFEADISPEGTQRWHSPESGGLDPLAPGPGSAHQIQLK